MTNTKILLFSLTTFAAITVIGAFADEIILTPDSTPPVVSLQREVLHKNASFTLTASAEDPESQIASLIWEQMTGQGQILFSAPNSSQTDVSADADGEYIIRLTASNGAGLNNFAEINMVWDATAPVLNEIESVPPVTNDATPIYKFYSNEIGTAVYSNGCQSNFTTIHEGENIISFNALTDGLYNCAITLTDRNGNQSNVLNVSQFTVDTTAPSTPTINPIISPTTEEFQTISGTKEENTMILINGSPVSEINDPTLWSYNFQLAAGGNNIVVSAQDAAGNTSQPASTNIEMRPACVSWTYSSWSACLNSARTRRVVSSSPQNCMGAAPEPLSEACENPPPAPPPQPQPTPPPQPTPQIQRQRQQTLTPSQPLPTLNINLTPAPAAQQPPQTVQQNQNPPQTNGQIPTEQPAQDEEAAQTVAELKGLFVAEETNGTLWYINPSDEKKYYLGDSTEVLDNLQKVSVPVKNKLLAKIKSKNKDPSLVEKLSGQIMENKGRFYYIHPEENKFYYLGTFEKGIYISKIIRIKTNVPEEKLDKITEGSLNQ